MAEYNTQDLPPQFTYLTDETGAFITTEDGVFIVIDGVPDIPPPWNGSGGNRLLCTSLIIDMGSPNQIQSALQPPPRTRDRKGNRIYWED